jgi:hypothetical protein
MKLFLLIVVLAGCRQLAGLDDPLPAPNDAVTDTSDTGDADNSSCYGTGVVQICLGARAQGDLELPTTLGGQPSCSADVVSGGTGLCVIAAGTITLPAGSTARASGSLPVVLIAHDQMTIAGTLDAASHRSGGAGPAANFSGCNDAGVPSTDGGGAGGSFGGLGGQGGGPGVAAPGAALPAPTSLHGGCAGHDGGGSQAGRFGSGGGAIYVISKGTISVANTGTINASGAGASDGEDGNTSGGGGGGSGGMIGLEAPTIELAGVVVANGGGGGEGADGEKGASGNDPIGSGPGLGGNSASCIGGPGGDGGSGAQLDGEAGTDGATGTTGGGGGGGSVGVIKLIGNRTGSGVVSPPPS